jgi:hypothetical protein
VIDDDCMTLRLFVLEKVGQTNAPKRGAFSVKLRSETGWNPCCGLDKGYFLV